MHIRQDLDEHDVEPVSPARARPPPHNRARARPAPPARTVRAMIGAKPKPMTSITVTFEVPSATRASSATMTVGSASTASTIRLSTSSTSPREIAHRPGRARCRRNVPSKVASGATVRMSREPAMTRENTSRPSWSVPNQCSRDGGNSVFSMSSAIGIVGHQRIGRRAHRPSRRATMASPIRKVGEATAAARRSRRSSRWRHLPPGWRHGELRSFASPRSGCAD